KIERRFAPCFNARPPASSIVGPSATGSVNGMPTSIAVTPSSCSFKIVGFNVSRPPSPAIMYGMNALPAVSIVCCNVMQIRLPLHRLTYAHLYRHGLISKRQLFHLGSSFSLAFLRKQSHGHFLMQVKCLLSHKVVSRQLTLHHL